MTNKSKNYRGNFKKNNSESNKFHFFNTSMNIDNKQQLQALQSFDDPQIRSIEKYRGGIRYKSSRWSISH